MAKTFMNIWQNGGMKSIDFTPWGGIDGFLQETSGGSPVQITRLRGLVPWLNKAINMTANAVGQLPYWIEDVADNEIDEEVAWGGVRNPQTLIQLTAASLCGGCAYWLIDTTNRAILSAQYLTPQSMQVKYDDNGEVTSFIRSFNGRNQALSLEQVVYFWLPDDTVEIGPAQLTPNRNAALSAAIIAAQDDALRQYGERGFIPPTILSAKGMTNVSDVERTERWWNAFLRGWTKTVAKIINAETMTPNVLGAGMDELRGSYLEITQQQIKNIAASYGIPNSTFLSDENSYATAMSDIRLWYTSSAFVSIYQTIEDSLTEQLWSRFGWNMEYEPEQLEAFSTDEVDKSGALSTLTSAFAASPEAALVAADVLGYDLSDEQKLAIEALGAEEVTEPPAELMIDTMQEIPEVVPMPTDEENAIAAEMMKWREFAERPRKREFETKAIPPALALRIKSGLHTAKGQDEIQAVFDSAVLELPIIRLAKAIEGMNE